MIPHDHVGAVAGELHADLRQAAAPKRSSRGALIWLGALIANKGSLFREVKLNRGNAMQLAREPREVCKFLTIDAQF